MEQVTSSSSTQTETSDDLGEAVASKSVQQNFFKKSFMKLVAASVVSSLILHGFRFVS